MSSTQLAVNTILFLSFCLHFGTSSLISGKNVENSKQTLNIIDSNTQSLISNQTGKAKKSENSEQQSLKTESFKDSTAVISISDTDVNENLEVDHHQIHKRFLNKDFPLNRRIGYGEPHVTLFRQSESRKQGQPTKLSKVSDVFSSGGEKTSWNFDDKIALNDSFRIDDSGPYSGFQDGRNHVWNDTTKSSLKDSYRYIDIYQKCAEGNAINNQNYLDPLSDESIDFICKPSDSSKTIDLFSIDNLNKKNSKPTKREATETSRNSSYDTTAIKQEIDKIYKDISDNVRLLSKLRDRESHLLKRPSKKRWIIVDNTMDGLSAMDDNERKRRCSQELTVEMDTNRDATPDRLEHIERKVEEEILQVNVPLKCNH